MNVYMPGLTWDCTCGAINDAVASSCAACGLPPGDLDVVVGPRRVLPFSAAPAEAAEQAAEGVSEEMSEGAADGTGPADAAEGLLAAPAGARAGATNAATLLADPTPARLVPAGEPAEPGEVLGGTMPGNGGASGMALAPAPANGHSPGEALNWGSGSGLVIDAVSEPDWGSGSGLVIDAVSERVSDAGDDPAREPVAIPPARPRPSLLDDPEPEPAPPPRPRRRSAALSVGFVIVVLALIAAVALVVVVVNHSANSKPPNPNQVTTASLP